MIASTPEPPYYAVIFSSRRTSVDEGYDAMADHMLELAMRQPGYLGKESTRGEDGFGITVSYWATLEDIASWKAHAQHQVAQRLGREKWYAQFVTRIARVERSSPGP